MVNLRSGHDHGDHGMVAMRSQCDHIEVRHDHGEHGMVAMRSQFGHRGQGMFTM